MGFARRGSSTRERRSVGDPARHLQDFWRPSFARLLESISKPLSEGFFAKFDGGEDVSRLAAAAMLEPCLNFFRRTGVTGWGEWLVIAAAIVFAFSFRKLPQLGGAVAESIRSFKKGLKGENPPPRDVTRYDVPPDKKSP